MPTLNEERGLSTVLQQAQELNVATVVVDGGSVDRTREVAASFGVPVVEVSRGKGRVWHDFLTTFPYKDWEYVAMVDGDATYDLSALPRLLATGADMTVGVRHSVNGDTPRLRAAGARGLSILAGWLTRSRCPDLLSGFRVMRTEAIRDIRLTSERFGLESELTIEYLRRGLPVAWVPVEYRRRHGESKLSPWVDGWDILVTILRARYRKL